MEPQRHGREPGGSVRQPVHPAVRPEGQQAGLPLRHARRAGPALLQQHPGGHEERLQAGARQRWAGFQKKTGGGHQRAVGAAGGAALW